MLRKLITVAAIGALGYGLFQFMDNSNFFGTRGHDRNERMTQIEDAVTDR